MEERYKKIGNLFFLGLFFAISISIMVIAGLKMSNVKHKLQEQKDKIATLEGDSLSKDKASEDIKKAKNVDVIEPTIKAGNEVAKLQNDYSTIDITDSGVVKATKDAIKAHFDESSTNASAVWYMGTSTKAIWSFATPYRFNGTLVDGLWICEDENGKVLMFKTAVYDVNEKIFKDFKSFTTQYGYDAASGTPEGNPQKDLKDRIDSIINDINEKTGDEKPSNDMTEEDWNNIWKAREENRTKDGAK
jgi:hypothetical protein